MLLDELERDALTEIVNIGVRRAAANLRKMVEQQVLLSVPPIDVYRRRARPA
jgi:chemotaxis protein CheC